MSELERWIVVPNWREFQHYKDRGPNWIKAYTRLLDDDDWLGLSHHLRGVLLGLWLAYARADGQLRDDGSALARRLGGNRHQRVTRRDLDTLNQAGFIQFSASKPLALRYQAASPEVEREIEKNNPVTEPVLQHPAREQDQPGSGNGVISDDELDQLAELARLTAAAAPKDIPW